ncbi:hypothetical protein SAMN05216364_1005101 [Porphyromonadaceae bacterium KHP3R9]|nr:hypothetical protein SAMN05216364_1005101 [Porphyromonadaceae bacterium KHP3R9]
MIKRAYAPSEILQMKKKSFPFDGDWFDAFDNPEQSGVWFIWGNSGNGKSSFVMQLCRELARFGKVVFNALEEAQSKTMQDAISRFGLDALDGKLSFVCEPMDHLCERLARRRGPDFAIIDSFQYTRITYRQYIDIKEANRGKLLIFVSHAEGKQPAGRAAKSVMYDADLKIHVEGYRARSKGRYIGEKGYIDIWKTKALAYWGEKTDFLL